MSLAHIIGRGTLWVSAGSIVLKVIGLTSIFIILKRLSVYEYGLTELALSATALMSIFLLPGLSEVVIADMGRERSSGNTGEMKLLYRNYFLLQFFLALIAWGVVFFGSDILANYFSGQISTLLKILSFTFVASPFRSLFMVAFSVYFQFLLRSLYTVVEEVFKLFFLLIAFVGLNNVGPAGVVFAIVGAQFAVMGIMAPFLWKTYCNFRCAKIEHNQPFWSLLYKHGKWSVFSSYLNNFTQNIRIFIIRFFLGTEAVGVYAVALGLYNHTTSLFSLSGVVGPIIPQYINDEERFHKIVSKGIKYQLIAYLILGTVALIFFPPIILLLFPNYTASMPLFRILLLALIPSGISIFITPVFNALKAQKSLFFAVALKGTLTIILAPPLIYFFGIYGVAIEVVSTLSLYVAERYRIIHKMIPRFYFALQDIYTKDEIDMMILSKIKVRALKLIGR